MSTTNSIKTQETPAGIDTIRERLELCAVHLESLETLPKPYDLYYAIRTERQWSYACANIGVSDIRATVTHLDTLRATIEQLQAKLYCCCGGPIDHSPYEGHSPVSMYDYALDCANKRIAELEEAANLFLKPRMAIFTDSRQVDADLVALAGVLTNDVSLVGDCMDYLRKHADDVAVPLDVQITTETEPFTPRPCKHFPEADGVCFVCNPELQRK